MSNTIQATASASAPCTAELVWQTMQNFGNLDWAVGIQKVELVGEGIGMVRKVLLDGSTDWLDEKLIEQNHDAMSFTYVIEGQGMPGMENYKAKGQVEAKEDGTSLLTWTCQADATPEQAPLVEQVLTGMADGIVNLFSAQFSPFVAP